VEAWPRHPDLALSQHRYSAVPFPPAASLSTSPPEPPRLPEPAVPSPDRIRAAAAAASVVSAAGEPVRELSPLEISGGRPLLGLGRQELEAWAQAAGQPAYRGRQLHEWIYARGARDPQAITVLPKTLREQLDPALIGRLPLRHRSDAADGTVKLLLGTADGLSLETVGIPSGERLTVCVSSQVGCPMACRFCATGKGGLQRSLAVHEIVDQVLSVREAMGRRPSHVVFMGMGEPLLNIDAVLAAIDCLCRDLGMAQRQITVSTVGVPGALPTLADRARHRLGRVQFTLAVSLHAPDQSLRHALIPTAQAYPIEALLDDCRRYVAETGRRVSFEYILLGGVNDQPCHAEALARRLRGFQSHVNLISYNPIEEEEFRRPDATAVEAFRRLLRQRHVAVSVRTSRGLDADAACGQLRRRLETAPAP
jgi:23S rRNA (adenine2503-C2)-methyltransferase